MTVDTADKVIKVEKWDQNAVRIALDDASKKAILELDYEENFRLIDTRLLISTVAVLFGLYALLWDYLYPFPESKPVLMICALSYFALMGIFTLHANYMEKNIFLVAHQKDPSGVEPPVIWTLSSTMLKYDKNYTLSIQMHHKARARTDSLTLCVGDVIDENGVLLYKKFKPMVVNLHDSIALKKKKE